MSSLYLRRIRSHLIVVILLVNLACFGDGTNMYDVIDPFDTLTKLNMSIISAEHGPHAGDGPMDHSVEPPLKPPPPPPLADNNETSLTNITLFAPAPHLPLFAPTPLNDAANEVEMYELETAHSKAPPSFTILMDFQNDGTTSFQILNQNNAFWSDSGKCRHGQIYDPLTGICRDVFCAHGYMLGPNGCVPDSNQNSSYYEPIKKPSPEMKLEITLKHYMCVFIVGYNDTNECQHDRVLNPANTTLLKALRASFSRLLNIDIERIQNMSLITYNELSMAAILNPDQSSSPSWRSDLNPDIEVSDPEPTRPVTNESSIKVTKIERYELLIFSFVLKDNKLFQNDTAETIRLFYYLTLLTLDARYFNVKNHRAYMTDVNEIKQSVDEGWCNSAGDRKQLFRDNFRILANFEDVNKPEYFIYVDSLKRFYRVGYYYLTVVFKQTVETVTVAQPNTTPVIGTGNKTKNTLELFLDLQTSELFSRSDINNTFSRNKRLQNLLSVIDVTKIVLDTNMTGVLMGKLASVCNSPPRIRFECNNHETVRLRLCELDMIKDQSYCLKTTGDCFYIDQYEMDSLEPDKYIRVCKPMNRTDFLDLNSTTPISDLNRVISGWISLLLICISLICMLFCLVTYALFGELRNIPGWNIISLTLALTLAQFSFLMGSFASRYKVVCFVISLATHYGFLASFFWMNVIAFDLFRNFREKASHVLLQSLNVRHRLWRYSLYGWISPLLIVIVCLIVDIEVKDAMNLVPFRPCYAGFLRGCDRISSTNLITYPANVSVQVENAFFNQTSILASFGQNDTDETAEESCPAVSVYYLIMASKGCWIRNGKANLLFFGLPIAVIIVVNAVFYVLTIYNIRMRKRTQRDNLRRISRQKVATDEDVKFYIQMGFILGFTWIIGFFLTTFDSSSSSGKNFVIVEIVLTYLFIILNPSIGLFIFFAFIFKKDVKHLYGKFFRQKISPALTFNAGDKIKKRFRENSASSAQGLYSMGSKGRTVSAPSTTNNSKKSVSTTASTNSNDSTTNLNHFVSNLFPLRQASIDVDRTKHSVISDDAKQDVYLDL